MKHLKYFENSSDVKDSEITARPLVYYIDETDSVFYFDIDDVEKSIGEISSNNEIKLNTDNLPSGEYTISFADSEGNELTSWMDITKFTI